MRDTAPARPLEAKPVDRKIEPELPDAEDPVNRSIEPDTPAEPTGAVASNTDPEPELTLLTLVTLIPPPNVRMLD